MDFFLTNLRLNWRYNKSAPITKVWRFLNVQTKLPNIRERSLYCPRCLGRRRVLKEAALWPWNQSKMEDWGEIGWVKRTCVHSRLHDGGLSSHCCPERWRQDLFANWQKNWLLRLFLYSLWLVNSMLRWLITPKKPPRLSDVLWHLTFHLSQTKGGFDYWFWPSFVQELIALEVGKLIPNPTMLNRSKPQIESLITCYKSILVLYWTLNLTWNIRALSVKFVCCCGKIGSL